MRPKRLFSNTADNGNRRFQLGNFLTATIALSAAFAIASTATTPATASSEGVDPTLQAQHSWFLENGVDADIADELTNKLSGGELIDSMNGSAPVAIATFYEKGWLVTHSTFQDGSLTISKLETPSAVFYMDSKEASTQSVGQCHSSDGGSGYRNFYECLVYGTNGSYFDMSFRADYTQTTSGTGIINSVYSPYAFATAGTAPRPTLTIVRRSGNPALATARTQYSSATRSFTATLTLNVNGSSAWSTQSF